MPRSEITIRDLPPHLQRKALAQLDESKLGPESPLLELRKSRRRRRDPGLEHAEQVKVIEWADDPATQQRFPELDALYSIPNESFGQRDGAEKKARGRRKGMLDLCLPVPRRSLKGAIYGACYLEMKELAGSVRESQQERIRILRTRGNFADVAHSAEAAIAMLTYYLALPRPADSDRSGDVLCSSSPVVDRWKVRKSPRRNATGNPWDHDHVHHTVCGHFDTEAEAQRIADAFNALEAERVQQ